MGKRKTQGRGVEVYCGSVRARAGNPEKPGIGAASASDLCPARTRLEEEDDGATAKRVPDISFRREGVALARGLEMLVRGGGNTRLLKPFLDSYPGSVECRSARRGNSDWSAGELPIRVVADEETAECG